MQPTTREALWVRRARMSWPRVVCCAIAVTASVAGAIDNPDAPDYVADFEARIRPLEDRISSAPDDAQSLTAAVECERLLEAELADALELLSAQLEPEPRRALAEAQRAWLAWRRDEGVFIAREWTPAIHGSSSRLSRATYRISLTHERVRSLLRYLKEQPVPLRASTRPTKQAPSTGKGR